jgi:hypothetical protein
MTTNKILGKSQREIIDWLNRYEPSKPKAIFNGMKEDVPEKSYVPLVNILFRMRKQRILEKIDEKYCSTGNAETRLVSKEEQSGKEETMETLECINFQIDITELLLEELYGNKVEILKTLASKTKRKHTSRLNCRVKM